MHSEEWHSWIAVLTEEWQILSDRKKQDRKGQGRGLVFIKAGEYMGLNMGKENVMDLGGTGIIIGKSEKEHGFRGIQSMLGTFIH